MFGFTFVAKQMETSKLKITEFVIIPLPLYLEPIY